jgi:anti-sigma factor RsiW
VTHLELIVMPDQIPLPEDEARALLDAYVEGELDDETAARLEASLEESPALQGELDEMRATLEFLHAQPPPEMPADLLDKVRGAVEAERSKPAEVVAFRKRKVVVYAVEAAVGIAAVVALVVGLNVGPNLRAPQPNAIEAAGLGAEVADAASVLRAPGIAPERVLELARAAELELVDETELVFEGEARRVAHFVLQLRLAAAKRGGEVGGLVPDGERVRVTIDVR